MTAPLPPWPKPPIESWMIDDDGVRHATYIEHPQLTHEEVIAYATLAVSEALERARLAVKEAKENAFPQSADEAIRAMIEEYK